MSQHVHHLYGCSPSSLAGYLKALGVLRLVAQQQDENARGFWHDQHFVLVTRLSREELEHFFIRTYQPTAFVAPWNRGSGFLTDDAVLKTVEHAPAARFSQFQEGIRNARALCSQLDDADTAVRLIKDEAKQLPTNKREAYKSSLDYKVRLAAAERWFKSCKAEFIPKCRRNWRGSALEWMDAAIVLNGENEPSYPALFGTGGADGRLDFTNNFMQRLIGLFELNDPEQTPKPQTPGLLRCALFAESEKGMGSSAIGQFLPAAVGGANSSNGLQGGSVVNPWDLVLVFEGAILFSACSSKRMGTQSVSAVSAPFAVHACSAGFASASPNEESQRGEQWMPIWAAPATLPELKALISEGRAQVRRSAVRQPLDLARAIARMGVARGIVSFERFGYLERNGMSNLAIPLGGWVVAPQPHQDLLNDLDVWAGHLQRQARDKTAPARLRQLDKNLSDALMMVAGRGDQPAYWQNVLLILADIESCMATGSGFAAGPIPRLNSGWLAAADDGSPEIRLALSLAAQATAWTKDGYPIDAVRRHWLPLDRSGMRFAITDQGKRLGHDSRVVCMGRDLVSDACNLIQRRIMEAGQKNSRYLPMVALDQRTAADPADLAAFLAGKVDHERTLRLARALMSLDWRGIGDSAAGLSSPAKLDVPLDDAFGMVRFCWASAPLIAGEIDVPVKPEVFRRLIAGDLPGAIRLAAQHLRSFGVAAPVETAFGEPRLLAAAMAFPVSRVTMRGLVHCVQNHAK